MQAARNKTLKWLLPACALLLMWLSFSAFVTAKKKAKAAFRVGFYNVENLFDWEDDSQTDDQQFLPESTLNWTKERFERKIKNLAKAIKTFSPDILGVCEIENRKVLDYLLTKTELKNSGYSFIHYDSPDRRGIDLGLIYRKGHFHVTKTGSYAVIFPGDMSKPTRDILYVKGRTSEGSDLHVLVNHWPSRSGGAEATEYKRIIAAKTAKRLCDSIRFNDKEANIILLGDFNDYPENNSLSTELGAQADSGLRNANLYNLMGWKQKAGEGSYFYKNNWGFLDQIIVSESLLKNTNSLYTHFNKVQVVREKFLLSGKKHAVRGIPFSTYQRETYQGGYSDHLPVFVDFYTNKR